MPKKNMTVLFLFTIPLLSFLMAVINLSYADESPKISDAQIEDNSTDESASYLMISGTPEAWESNQAAIVDPILQMLASSIRKPINHSEGKQYTSGVADLTLKKLRLLPANSTNENLRISLTGTNRYCMQTHQRPVIVTTSGYLDFNYTFPLSVQNNQVTSYGYDPSSRISGGLRNGPIQFDRPVLFPCIIKKVAMKKAADSKPEVQNKIASQTGRGLMDSLVNAIENKLKSSEFKSIYITSNGGMNRCIFHNKGKIDINKAVERKIISGLSKVLIITPSELSSNSITKSIIKGSMDESLNMPINKQEQNNQNISILLSTNDDTKDMACIELPDDFHAFLECNPDSISISFPFSCILCKGSGNYLETTNNSNNKITFKIPFTFDFDNRNVVFGKVSVEISCNQPNNAPTKKEVFEKVINSWFVDSNTIYHLNFD